MSKNFSLSEAYKQAEKQYGLGKGEYFKHQEGANKMRVVSKTLPHESEYNGAKTFKWLCQIIDARDGKLKPYFMPMTVFKAIESLQLSDDYSFNEMPMPYYINVNAKDAGTKEVKYSVIPARENTPLSKSELKAIEEAPTVEELQDKINEKAQNKVQEPLPQETSINEISFEDIAESIE